MHPDLPFTPTAKRENIREFQRLGNRLPQWVLFRHYSWCDKATNTAWRRSAATAFH